MRTSLEGQIRIKEEDIRGIDQRQRNMEEESRNKEEIIRKAEDDIRKIEEEIRKVEVNSEQALNREEGNDFMNLQNNKRSMDTSTTFLVSVAKEKYSGNY